MNKALAKFVDAHDRYIELDQMRTNCGTPGEREFIHLQIMTTYLEVQYYARVIAGLQFADGMEYAEKN